jgi:hypothetical protein
MTMKRRGEDENYAKNAAIDGHEVVDLSQEAPTFSNLDAALAAIRKRNSCAAAEGGSAAAAAGVGGSPKHPRPPAAFRRSIGSHHRTGKGNADQQAVEKEVNHDEIINKILRQRNYFGQYYETAGANLSSAIYVSAHDDEPKMSAEELALKELQERRELEEKLAARAAAARLVAAAAPLASSVVPAPMQPVQSILRRHPRRTAQEIVNNARKIPCVSTVARYDRSASTDTMCIVVPILKKRLRMAISSTPILPPAAIDAAPVNVTRPKRSAGDTVALRRSGTKEMPPTKRRAATRPDDSDDDNSGDDDDDDDGNVERPLLVQPPPQQLVPRESTTTTVRAVVTEQRASGGGDGSSLVGRWVEKWFKVPESRQYRLYTGRVTSYDPVRQYYRVIYEDGDREEMTLDELTEILVSVGKKTS